MKIKALRLAKGLSLEALAAESKVAKNTIYQIENGEGNPTLETLEGLEHVLGEAVADIADSTLSQNQKSMLQTIWAAWPDARPEVKATCLYLLTEIPDYVSLLPEALRVKVLNAVRALGLIVPKGFS